MDSVAEYTYRRLPSSTPAIRLLEVKYADGTDSTAALYSLQNFSTSEAPSYDAISYTWGPKLPVEVVCVDGKRLHVRQNCGHVLRQISYFRTSQYFWIDAICINQGDVEERNEQVAVMADIYRNAQKVLVCNPAVDADTAFAMSLLQDVHFVSGLAQKREESSSRVGPANLASDERVQYYRGLIKLTQLPYFQRVWVVQEMQLAQEVFFCYGFNVVSASKLQPQLLLVSYEVLKKQTHDQNTELAEAKQHWDPLRSMIKPQRLGDYDQRDDERSVADTNISAEIVDALKEPGLELRHDATHLLAGAFNKRKDRGSNHSIWDVIRMCKTKQCEDPRDRIYGMLALIDWQGAAPIRPNYHSTSFDIAVSLCVYDLGGPVARQLGQNLRLKSETKEVVEGIAMRRNVTARDQQTQPPRSHHLVLKENLGIFVDLL